MNWLWLLYQNVNDTTSNAINAEQLKELAKLYQQLRAQQELDELYAILEISSENQIVNLSSKKKPANLLVFLCF